jgi:DNA-binding SARP family transcriptional activator
MAPASPPLSLKLLGPFEARVNSTLLRPLRARNGLWLLALLSLRGGSEIARGWLSGARWPDSLDPRGLSTLRQSLTDLREALGTERNRLRTPRNGFLSLELEGAEVDLIEFQRASAVGDRGAAVSLYPGPPLEGCHEQWVLQPRIRMPRAGRSCCATWQPARVGAEHLLRDGAALPGEHAVRPGQALTARGYELHG